MQICITPARAFLAMLQQYLNHMHCFTANLPILTNMTRSTGYFFSFPSFAQPYQVGHNVSFLPLPPRRMGCVWSLTEERTSPYLGHGKA